MITLVRKKPHWSPLSPKEMFDANWVGQFPSNPSVHIKETNCVYRIFVIAHGFKKEHCKIVLEENKELILTLEKKIKAWQEEEDVCHVSDDVLYSKFQQKIFLPDCNPEGIISVKTEKGVWTLLIPKK